MDANTLYERAIVAIRARNHGEARRLLSEAVRREPQHEKSWLALASVLNDMQQAIDCLERVLIINPQNGTAQEWLMLAQQEKSRRSTDSTEPLDEDKTDPALGEIKIDEDTDQDRPVPRLGKFLLDYKFVTENDLKAALLAQRRAAQTGNLRRLGDILLEKGILTRERLDFALKEQKRSFYNFIDW
jgi:tetratricopeptide (TPR) repeat protein